MKVDEIVQIYAMEHEGQYPSYEDLYELVESTAIVRRSLLSPQIDFETGKFFIHLGQEDIGKIGYVVSEDQQKYVIKAVGWGEQTISIYGIDIIRLAVCRRDTYFYNKNSPTGQKIWVRPPKQTKNSVDWRQKFHIQRAASASKQPWFKAASPALGKVSAGV
jgi:hypothetical protein